jgi:hypothetical protein
MSDAGWYRKLYGRLWRHPGFLALSRDEKLVALYVLLGPQTNRIGLFLFSIETAAGDLQLAQAALRRAIPKICERFEWGFDERARVIYVPSWWVWNPPANPNVLKGSLKDLDAIPPCALRERFVRNLAILPEVLRRTLSETLQRTVSGTVPETLSETLQRTVSGTVPETLSETVPRTVPTSVAVAVAVAVTETAAAAEPKRTKLASLARVRRPKPAREQGTLGDFGVNAHAAVDEQDGPKGLAQAPAPLPTQQALKHYVAGFEALYAVRPTLSGQKDGPRMAKLLRTLGGLDAVRARIDAYFSSTDAFFAEARHTLDLFFAAGTQTKLTVAETAPQLSPRGQQNAAVVARVVARIQGRSS